MASKRAARGAKKNKLVDGLTGPEQIVLNALDESKQQLKAARVAVKERYIKEMLESNLINAKATVKRDDEFIGQAFYEYLEPRTPELFEVSWNDGYRQECEDRATEIQAFLKGML